MTAAVGYQGDVHLLRIARRVVWWEPPDEVLLNADEFLCRVMALGTLEDANYVQDVFGPERLRAALTSAPPGVLDPRSWHYWHARLGVQPAGPLPARRFA